MNILMILMNNYFPPDVRVMKETKALIKEGHNIFLIARRRSDQLKKEVFSNVLVFRYTLSPASRNVHALLKHVVFICPLLLRIIKIVQRYRIDVLHVHDLPFSLVVVIAGKLLNKPVVFDMHEDYCELAKFGGIVRGLGEKCQPMATFVSAALRMEELLSSKMATKVIVVVDEFRYKLRRSGVLPRKIEVISNTVDTEELSKIRPKTHNEGNSKEKFLISYIGGFSEHRGLDTLVKALPLILREVPNAHLLLVGNGMMRRTLEKLAQDLNVMNDVTFTGWVSFDEAMNYVSMSDLCVIPHLITSLPHKFFQYMYFGKPILSSDTTSLKRMVEKAKCGIVFRAGDPEDLAKKLIEAKRNGILEQLGLNGKKAVETKYNWNETSKKLVKLYEEVMN